MKRVVVELQTRVDVSAPSAHQNTENGLREPTRFRSVLGSAALEFCFHVETETV